jgi:hypothetical protein
MIRAVYTPENPLPYTDTKPQGAADFYFAIQATFRFIQAKLGIEGLRRYWTDLGAQYFAPVGDRWKQGGLPAVADYWRAFFAAEPGAKVEVHKTDDCVTLDVEVCPAIKHLRGHNRELLSCYCQHCYFISEAIAAPAGLTVRIEGGNGQCRQRFLKRSSGEPPQNLDAIREARGTVPIFAGTADHRCAMVPEPWSVKMGLSPLPGQEA